MTFYICLILYLYWAFYLIRVEWERKGGGYSKYALLNFKFFDIHIIRVPHGACVPHHTDLSAYSHHRVNITWPFGYEGGTHAVAYSIGSRLYKVRGFSYYFRPDLLKHAVLEVTKGTQYTLTIGWRL